METQAEDPNMYRKAFSQSELAGILTVVVVMGSLLTIMGDSARRSARLGDDLSRLREMGTAGQSYGADFADYVWGLSWRVGSYQTQWPDLGAANSNMQAAGNQAVALMRERGGRPDIPPITSWVSGVMYSHLALADYLGEDLPAWWAISTGDRRRLLWAADPEGFDQGAFLPAQPEPTERNKRWPYSASFTMMPALFDTSLQQDRIVPGPRHSSYMAAVNTTFGGLRVSEIPHPAGKVMAGDRWSWHFGSREPYLIYEEARIPLLMVDGSASVRTSRDSNPGASPRNAALPVTIEYRPSAWEPALPGDLPSSEAGRFQWTRHAHLGRDFGGPDVDP